MGSTMAQTDKPYVIKSNDTIWTDPNNHQSGYSVESHYLTHGLTDAIIFNPETCIWYSGPVFNVSGTHHNYYFIESVPGQADKYHFLSAPLADHQPLGVSADLPTTAQLKNPDEIYYFYDWDQDAFGGGVARGHDDNGWWTVHWVSYNKQEQKWETSEDQYHFYDAPGAARYREVAITEHNITIVEGTEQGGIASMTPATVEMDYVAEPLTNQAFTASVSAYTYEYIPAYITYNFEGANHYFYDDGQGQGVIEHEDIPGQQSSGGNTTWTREWKLTGEGAEFLSFDSGSDVLTTNATSPTVYYRHENTIGHKWATLKLTVTYADGSKQEKTSSIKVKTVCQNPAQAALPVVNHNDVTVSWYPTATQYKVEWKKASETNWDNAGFAEVGDVTSYTIHDLEHVEYEYRVSAFCGENYLTPPTDPTGSFTPDVAPDLLIYGSVFGGGRAADVTGKVEVVIVNCDSIGAVYGGNDIAGTAGGADGSVITLGVNGSGNTPHTQAPIRIGSVYGGGNGYYAYGSQSFVPATTSTIAVNEKVYALSQSNQWNDSVWANTGTTAVSKPSISQSTITVTNDYVKIDSLFGGAKNAFVTNNNGVTTTNTKTTINGGTIFAVFGGNNVGGTLGTARQKVDVTATTQDLNPSTGTTKLGRTHGIGYLFGGGNLVAGTTTEVNITGGHILTSVYGGNEIG